MKKRRALAFLALSALILSLASCNDTDATTGASETSTPSTSARPSPNASTTATASVQASPSTSATATATPAASTPSSTVTTTPTTASSAYALTLQFTGPSLSSNAVYAAWLEDESGTCIQNIYVCNRLLPDITGDITLTGTAIPNWKLKKYTQNNKVDGVTGASIQGSTGLSVTRSLSIGSVRKLRAYFEIDRSWNDNTYFSDRPSFVYRSEVIDLDSLQASYALSLYGWMSNDTGTSAGTLSQEPLSTISGWKKETLMTDLSYIAPTNDMVSSLSVTVTN
jgi:hypothetical protein